jgi:hypothetical protein
VVTRIDSEDVKAKADQVKAELKSLWQYRIDAKVRAEGWPRLAASISM